ncbi:MAG TPA: hypothetical protein VEC12_03470 [Bacteroidia bacterium]|nr:hypothetical protein [Bacteroidia bacterium]
MTVFSSQIHTATKETVAFKRLDIAQARANVNAFVDRYNGLMPSAKDKVRGSVLTTLMRVCDKYVRQNSLYMYLQITPSPAG